VTEWYEVCVDTRTRIDGDWALEIGQAWMIARAGYTRVGEKAGVCLLYTILRFPFLFLIIF